MLARRLFVGCLALVIFARAVHCLYVDVRLCALATAADRETPPISDPQEADPNESGCLCKGAPVGIPCLLADLEQQGKLIALAHLVLTPTASVSDLQSSAEPDARDLLWRPPRSGRMVRALIASWQI
ncbi:MAG: hypothetical protein HY288_09635 [Planctomycetia bacterium]|nr:hypothetical protein [Planctomycetia bacterium]